MQLFKFPDSDKFLFKKASPPYPLPPLLKQERNLETICLKQHGGPGTTF